MHRQRGVWRAKILVALSAGITHFNALGRACHFSDPTALSRILRRLRDEGSVARTVHSVGPPTATSWALTTYGRTLVEKAEELIAEIGTLRNEPTFQRSRARIGSYPVTQ